MEARAASEKYLCPTRICDMVCHRTYIPIQLSHTVCRAMTTFEQSDVERMIDLIAPATDPTSGLNLADRRLNFASGIAELIGADVWMWSSTISSQDVPNDVMTTCLQERGWSSNGERQRVLSVLTSPDFNARGMRSVFSAMAEGRRVTFGNGEVFPPEYSEELSAAWRATGFEWFLLSVHPLDRYNSSNIGFHRRCDKQPFSRRDKAVLHCVFQRAGWLHQYGLNEAVRETTLRLSPRERQTLIYLLAGHSHKEIAERMGISQHTVNDYAKQIHSHFQVSSRAELQANFFLGGLNAQPNVGM